MKASLATLVALALLGGTSCVLAASSVDLTVKGSITPSACTPGLSQGGSVDYGKIPAKDLAVERMTDLPEVILQLGVNCESATVFALRASDNRAGSSYLSLPIFYGLGLVNGSQKLGVYELRLFNPVGDTPVTPLYSADNGETWLSNPSGTYFATDSWAGFGDTSTGWPYSPKALRNVAVDLKVLTSIAPANSLTLTEEVPLDGHATIDLVYL